MNDADLQERMQLAIERISEIKEEDQTIWDTLAKMDAGAKNLKTYFDSVAEFILYVYDVYEIVSQPGKIDLPLSKLQEINHNLYADILPEHYDASFANPDYAVEKLGEYGKYLCMLYAEIRAMIAYAYEDEMQAMISLMELFLEVYGIFTASEGEKLPDEKEIKEAIYYYMYDYADVLVARRIRETVTCVNPFAYDIIMQSDLMTPDYLYAYGEYIGENELRMAQYLAKLPEEKIERLARTYVQGFIKGFETMRIDISPKKSVNIRYAIGQERMVKAAIQMFEKEGLASILFRYPVSRMNRKATIRTGYAATPANKQCSSTARLWSGSSKLWSRPMSRRKKLRLSMQVRRSLRCSAKIRSARRRSRQSGNYLTSSRRCLWNMRRRRRRSQIITFHMTSTASRLSHIQSRRSVRISRRSSMQLWK